MTLILTKTTEIGEFKQLNVKMQDKNNATTQGDARYTLVWEKHDDKWLIVHEHLSSTVR